MVFRTLNRALQHRVATPEVLHSEVCAGPEQVPSLARRIGLRHFLQRRVIVVIVVRSGLVIRESSDLKLRVCGPVQPTPGPCAQPGFIDPKFANEANGPRILWFGV